MLVRGMLEIPPVEGRVVVPRTALIMGSGHPQVFVETARDPTKFERRQVSVIQETDDRAVIESGLRAGEKVVSVGALLFAQMYEDHVTASSGASAHATPEPL